MSHPDRTPAPAELTPDDGPAGAVQRLRSALAAKNVDAVRRSLAGEARRPSERDLLVDLIAAEGIEAAVERLAKFWGEADAAVESVRMLPNDEAEVYERVFPPGASMPLHTVSLVRMRQDRWRVVSTTDAPDDAIRVFVLRRAEAGPIDDFAFTRSFTEQYGEHAQLLIDDGEGVLGHPTERWVARTRGPLTGASLERARQAGPQGMAAEAAIEVAMAASADPELRLRQLRWLTQAVAVLAGQDRASWVYLPSADKLVATRSIAHAAQPAADLRTLANAWVRLSVRGGAVSTRGMSYFLAPELESPLADWADVAAGRKMVGNLAVAMLEGRLAPTLGSIVRVAGHRLRIELGRRGPEPGRSYGKGGAVMFRLADRDGAVAQSATRLRIDL